MKIYKFTVSASMIVFLAVLLWPRMLMALPLEVEKAFQGLKLIDGPVVVGESDNKHIASEYLKDNWRSLMKEAQGRPRLEQIKFIALAMDVLSDVEYLEFVIVSLSMFRDGKLDASCGRELLLPNDSKEGFFAVNYEEPRLRSVLMDVRDLYKDPNLASFVDDVLSGKAKIEFQAYRKGYGLTARASVMEQISSGNAYRGGRLLSDGELSGVGDGASLVKPLPCDMVPVCEFNYFVPVFFVIFAGVLWMGVKKISQKLRSKKCK